MRSKSTGIYEWFVTKRWQRSFAKCENCFCFRILPLKSVRIAELVPTWGSGRGGWVVADFLRPKLWNTNYFLTFKASPAILKLQWPPCRELAPFYGHVGVYLCQYRALVTQMTAESHIFILFYATNIFLLPCFWLIERGLCSRGFLCPLWKIY